MIPRLSCREAMKESAGRFRVFSFTHSCYRSTVSCQRKDIFEFRKRVSMSLAGVVHEHTQIITRIRFVKVTADKSDPRRRRRLVFTRR